MFLAELLLASLTCIEPPKTPMLQVDCESPDAKITLIFAEAYEHSNNSMYVNTLVDTDARWNGTTTTTDSSLAISTIGPNDTVTFNSTGNYWWGSPREACPVDLNLVCFKNAENALAYLKDKPCARTLWVEKNKVKSALCAIDHKLEKRTVEEYIPYHTWQKP